MQSYYQVGEVDENGFVCLGIEERKVHKKTDKRLNKTFFGIEGSYNSGSDDSSCDEYSSGYHSNCDAKSRDSSYKKSLDFLVEQGVRVRDLPKDSN